GLGSTERDRRGYQQHESQPHGKDLTTRDRKKRQAGLARSSIIPLSMPSERDILQLLHTIGRRLDGDVSLDALAAKAGWSRFHFHRAFRRVTGETPKQYTLRVRVERAAARLLTQDGPILEVAAGVGFASHAVFTRAFRRHFGCTPVQYRVRARRTLRTEVR